MRDFFISFTKADLEIARAIKEALEAAGFSTWFHPDDVPSGAHILQWMDKGLEQSRQTISLVSKAYLDEGAEYSHAEAYGTLWEDVLGRAPRLVPVKLQELKLPPLLAALKHIDASGLSAEKAAALVVKTLAAEAKRLREGEEDLPADLPEIFKAPYRSNRHFTGREEALNALHGNLSAGTSTAITAALAGLAGIGKTTLAAEYCYRFGGEYEGVWTIRAEQRQTLLEDLSTLGARLGLEQTGNVEEDTRGALEALGARNRSWLLVYDNVPDAGTVVEFLPDRTVRVIITSRSDQFGGLAEVMRLDQWEPEVTAEFLLARSARNDRAGAEMLATHLDGLPLAAEQAAAYLGKYTTIGFESYAENLDRLLKKPRPEGAAGDYPDTVYAAFVASLEMVAKAEYGTEALDLLRLCAFLSPDGVHLDLFEEPWSEEPRSQALHAVLNDEFARAEMLAIHTSLSLAKLEGDHEQQRLVFHRLPQNVTRDWMGQDERNHWGEQALNIVWRLFPSDAGRHPSRWSECARLSPHIEWLELVRPRTNVAGQKLEILLSSAGFYAEAVGNLAGALRLRQRCVALARVTRIGKPLELLELAVALSNLAMSLISLDQLDPAEDALKEALEIEQACMPEDGPLLASTRNNLANLYWRRHQHAEAEEQLIKALELCESAYGSRSFEYMACLGNLGALYDTWATRDGGVDRRQKARSLNARSSELAKELLGLRNTEVAIRVHNFAVSLFWSEAWSEATHQVACALAIHLSLDLSDHPNTVKILLEYFHCLKSSGQTEKVARIRAGDVSDLLPIIAEIEEEHRAWVAEDPENRDFGPPPPEKYELPELPDVV
ncbi:MAG: TIR domain-containing protein [Pseudomonadota bacterium]